MLRYIFARMAFGLVFAALAAPLSFAQEAAVSNPPPYLGPQTHVDGVFVTPVPGASFSATAELETTQVLSDGTSETKKTINQIARDFQGRIYNERRRLVPISFTGTPRLLSFHIYDPATKLNTFLDPFTHIARQSIFRASSQSAPFGAASGASKASESSPEVQEEDLGTEFMENVQVHGIRVTKTIPHAVSGTGMAVVVTDEYWYSDELHINMLVKHKDSRTGEQTVTVTRVNRAEPDPARFQIPPVYKVVDETPEN